jgi:hypothetical protein
LCFSVLTAVGLHPNAELQRIHWLDSEGRSHGWQWQRRKVKGWHQCTACLHSIAWRWGRNEGGQGGMVRATAKV